MTLIIPPGRISTAISFITGAWTAGWLKLVLICVLVGGGFWWFRIWLNRHDDRIFEDGKQRAIAVMETQYISTWKQKLAEAKIIADAGAENLKVASLKMAEVNARFPVIFAKLDDLQKSVDAKWVVYVQNAGAVEPSELDANIRAISNDPSILPAHR